MHPFTYHDMCLDSLHDIRKEALAFGDETVPPHLVGDDADQVRGEQDFLEVWRVVEMRLRDLEPTNKALQYVLVLVARVLQ